MTTTVLAVTVVAGLVLLALAAMRPSAFRIVRSQRIQAPADRIFPFVNDFHAWASWSPYERLDPAMTRSFGGAASGRGSTYGWSGNSKAGQGRMEIMESVASSRIGIDLQFEKPWKARNQTAFTFDDAGDATTVVWSMEGQHQFMGKAMSLVINMDKMVGKDFEAGLLNLKTLSER